MTYRDRTTGEALLTYDEDNPCPHCGRRGAESVYLTRPEPGRRRCTDVYPHIQRRCAHCGCLWAERGGRVMTIDPTLDELAAAVETVRENLWRQSRWPDSVVFLQGAEARALLEYIGALERDGNGWRSVAAVRQERIVELERERERERG